MAGERFPLLVSPDEERKFLVVPHDNEWLLAKGVGRLATQGFAIRFGEGSLLRERIGDLRSTRIWPASLILGGYPVIGDALATQSRLTTAGESIWHRLQSSTGAIGRIVASKNAWEAGNQVRQYHRGIEGQDSDGTMVSARHPKPYGDAWTILMWINEQTRMLYDNQQLTPAEWNQWWDEARIAFECQGVNKRALPDTYQGYRARFAEICADQLTETPTVRRARAQLEAGSIDRPPQIPPRLWTRRFQTALSQGVRLIAYGGLPEEARKAMGIPALSPKEQLALKALDAAIKKAWPLPDRLSHHPVVAEAVHPPRTRWHHAQIRANWALTNLAFEGSDENQRLQTL